MNGRAEKIGERVRDLTVRFGADVMRSLQRYNELLEKIVGGELDDTAVGEVYVRFVRDETERYFRSVADVSAGYYDALLELGSLYNPPFFERASRWRQQRPQASARQGGAMIALRGSVGEEAVSTFRVANEGNGPEEVAFIVSEFTGPGGTTPFRPPLQLQPARFALERFESQLVSVRLPLGAGLFVPNQRYSAVVSVRKRDPFDLRVEVEVMPPPDGPPGGDHPG